MLTGILLSRLFMAVKITSQHAQDLKCRESQFESDLATQAARFEEEKHALTQRFKNEMCDLRKVLYCYKFMFMFTTGSLGIGRDAKYFFRYGAVV